MNEPNNQKHIQWRKTITPAVLARGGQILFMLLFLGLVLFIGSGNIRWSAAWAFLGINLVTVLINAILMMRTNPETVAERGTAKGWKDWDKLVSGFFALFQYLLLPLTAALDARLEWSKGIGIFWQGLGGLGYSLGMALTSWSMITNAYFSTAARIQSDRGQQVCQTGPYHFIRHPGYTGIVFQAIGAAILLGSLWALIPAGIAGGLIALRTMLEDRMLQDELEGYKKYAHEVKYRLLPRVW